MQHNADELWRVAWFFSNGRVSVFLIEAVNFHSCSLCSILTYHLTHTTQRDRVL